MKNRLSQIVLPGLAALLVVALAGCATCKPGKQGPIGRYSLDVTLDESLKNNSVIVDLVGVNPSNLPRWEGYDMGRYWKEGDPMRNDADKVILNFVSGQALSRNVAVSDAIWDKWKAKGVTHVIVLADLPGVHASKPGSQDARRQILALDKCNWPDGTTGLKVLVQRSGMLVLTPVRAPQ